MRFGLAYIFVVTVGLPQEAGSGFEVRSAITASTTVSSQPESAPRVGGPVVPGLRMLMYPTWKLNTHWTVAGSVQAHTRPYFVEQLQNARAWSKIRWTATPSDLRTILDKRFCSGQSWATPISIRFVFVTL